jgi:DNA-packaging protein gp3
LGAPKGNQFWKLRSTHGRDKLFATPALLLEACQEYFNWVDSKPFYRVEALKGGDKAGKLIKVPNMQPYTIQGLCIYLDCNSVWFNHFEKALEGKEDDLSKDFSKILTHVREIIYNQKFVGAAVGAFNHSIIQRDLNLREKTELTGEGGRDLFNDKTDDDLKALLRDALKKLE